MKDNKCEKKIVFAMFWRSFFLQALWNFERMQNVGFAFVLLPALRIIYPDKEKRKEVLLRHLEFFNTNPYMVNIIFGIVCSMEEELAAGEINEFNSINSIKINTAGPLAAIGDKFFWATWRPFCAVLSIGLMLFFYQMPSFNGTWLPPLFYIVIYNIFIFPFRYWSLVVGCRFRNRIIKVIAGLEFKYLTDIVRYLAMFFMVFVIVFYIISFSKTLGIAAVFVSVFILSMILISQRFSAGFVVCSVFLISFLLGWLEKR